MRTIFLKRNKINLGIIITGCFALLLLSFVYSLKVTEAILQWALNNGNRHLETEDIFKTGRELKIFFDKTLPPPGVIVKTKGGIGNQLFEYACSYALSRDVNRTLYSWFVSSKDQAEREFQPVNRVFALDHFNIPIDNIVDDTTKIKGLTLINDGDLLEGKFENSSSFLQQDGYCQSELYWEKYKEEIRMMFQPRPEAINLITLQKFIDKIKSSESVAAHVRRGDFTNDNLNFYYVPISYQRQAIKRMVKVLEKRGISKPVFFVFSDDIWATSSKLKDFEKKYEMVYVSSVGTTSIEDFYLMTMCKHNIIPDSTFSWWTAYLNANPDKVVITSAFSPEFWKLWENKDEKRLNMRLYGTLYHSKDWIVIDPFSGGGR